MRNIIILIAIGICSCTYAQKIKKKEIDKFTKAEVIETTAETLYSVSMGFGTIYELKYYIRRINGEYSMPASILMDEVVKYTEGDGIIMLLDNDETISLETVYTGIGGETVPYTYTKAYRFDTVFLLSEENIETLKHHKINSIRVRYLGGHYDRDLKEKKKDLLMRSLKLFEKL